MKEMTGDMTLLKKMLIDMTTYKHVSRFPNYCLGTSNGAWPVAKGRAIASFPYFPYAVVDESRSDSEKMDKKEKSDDYDSPSDFWSVF